MGTEGTPKSPGDESKTAILAHPFEVPSMMIEDDGNNHAHPFEVPSNDDDGDNHGLMISSEE